MYAGSRVSRSRIVVVWWRAGGAGARGARGRSAGPRSDALLQTRRAVRRSASPRSGRWWTGLAAASRGGRSGASRRGPRSSHPRPPGGREGGSRPVAPPPPVSTRPRWGVAQKEGDGDAGADPPRRAEGHRGLNWATLGPKSEMSGRSRPNLGDVDQLGAKFAQLWSEFGQLRAKCDMIWTTFRRCRPDWASFGQNSPKSSRFGRFRINLVRLRPDSDCLTKFGPWSDFVRVWSNSVLRKADSGQTSGDLPPDCGPVVSKQLTHMLLNRRSGVNVVPPPRRPISPTAQARPTSGQMSADSGPLSVSLGRVLCPKRRTQLGLNSGRLGRSRATSVGFGQLRPWFGSLPTKFRPASTHADGATGQL